MTPNQSTAAKRLAPVAGLRGVRRCYAHSGYYPSRMTLELDGHLFTTMMGSDLQRDGMFLELQTSTSSFPLMEAFHCDDDSSFAVTGFGQSVPISVVEQFLVEARQRLIPSIAPNDESEIRTA